MSFDPLESILIVFQNPAEGKQDMYDDWYTNVHIRDAMRLDGAIATQRFIRAPEQLVLNGKPVAPAYWAHTIYEWESAAKSVEGHTNRAGTPLMEITRDCEFKNLRDYFFRPVFLSHGWSRESGFRRGSNILTALIVPPKAGDAAFIDWFQNQHAPDTLALGGFGSIGLFSLHEEQSLPHPFHFPLVAIYALTDRAAALRNWAARHDAGSSHDLFAQANEVEIGCWQPRIARLLASDVLTPPPAALAEETRARELYAGNYFTQAELGDLLFAG